MARQPLVALVLIAVIVGAGVWFLYSGRSAGPGRLDIATPVAAAKPGAAPAAGRLVDCSGAPAYAAAAVANADSLVNRVGAPMGREETGWEIYAPLAAREVGTACGPGTPGFAAALAAWQTGRRLPGDGIVTPQTLEAMRLVWHARRPFVAATAHGGCPAAQDETALADTTQDEGYGGKPVKLRPRALDAWRRMVAAARAEQPQVAADRRLLAIVSGFRGPAEEALNCLGGGCGTPARAACSAHRTGLAVDLYLGQAPGFAPASSADPNRLYLSRSAAYRWLVGNAARFGFVPYAFEPWHWEWTGEAP